MTRIRKFLAVIITFVLIITMCGPPINLFTTKASAATPYAYNIKVLSWSNPSVWTSKALTVEVLVPTSYNLVGKSFTYRLYTVKSSTSSTCHELVKETQIAVGSSSTILIEETGLSSGKRYTLDLEYIDTSTEPYTYYRAVMGHYAGSGSTISNTDPDSGETTTVITNAGPQIVLESWSADGTITFKSQANKKDYDDYSYSNWYLSKTYNTTSSSYLLEKQTGTSSGAKFSSSGVCTYTTIPNPYDNYVRCADKLKISGTWGMTYYTYMFLRQIPGRLQPDAGFTTTGTNSTSGIFTVNPNGMATRYKIYLTNNSSYSISPSYVIVKQSSYATTNSISFSGLDTTQQYYAIYTYGNSGIGDHGWRDTVVQTPWTFSYSEALSPPSISTSATTNSVSVTLGTVSHASSYEVQLSSSSSFSSPTTKTGMSVTFTGLSSGTTYYVRAKSKSNSSDYTDSDWSSYTSIKTSSVTQLAAPTVSTSATQTSISVTLGTVSNASSYEIQLSSSSSYSSPTTKTGKSATFTGLSMGTTYYIRAKAVAGSSSYSDSSWSTKTVSTSSVTYLSSPTVTVSSVTSSSAYITASSVSYASSYEIQYSTSSYFSSYSTLTSRYGTISGLYANTTYYVRAKAKTTTSGYADSSWSSAVSFTTSKIAMSSPTVSVSNSDSSSYTPSISWTSPTGAGSFAVQLSTSSGFSPLYIDTSTSSTSYSLSSLPSGVRYYVRVKAYSGSSSYSDSSWSSSVSVINGVPTTLSAPTISSCTGNGTGSISLTWSSITNVGSYTIQYSTSSSFSSATTATSTSTSYTISNLNAATVYYVRVKANASTKYFNDSSYSSSRSAATALSAPSNALTVEDANNIVVTYSKVDGANRYVIEYSTKSDFSNKSTTTVT